MFKKLIEAIERLAIAQEKANRLNAEFVLYRKQKDQENEEYTKKVNDQNREDNEKLIQQQEQLIEVAKDNFQNAIEKNNTLLISYMNDRFEEMENKIEEVNKIYVKS